MTVWEGVFVLVAGIWAGGINTVVGSGTLVSFPVLLYVGLPPVTANISNAVGLFPGSFVGAYGYRRELRGQGRRVALLSTATLLGSTTGAILLLQLPPQAFRAIVPALIVLALLLVVFGPRLTAALRHTRVAASPEVTPATWASTAFTGVYGGYFGAAQGVLQMAFFGLFLRDDIQRQNALKNVLAGLVNLVPAVIFVATDAAIDWTAAGLVAAGSVVGGVVGAQVGRRLSPTVLRGVIVAVGLAALVKLVA